MSNWLLAFMLAALAGGACAAEADAEKIPSPGVYVCTAKSVSELNREGLLEETDFAKAVKMYESRFAVDRATGVTLGGSFGTWDAKNVQVLNPGSNVEGFKVLYLADTRYTHLRVLSVNSYVDGDEKPFVGLNGNIVITGTCVLDTGGTE